MKILIIDTYYSGFLDSFYKEHPEASGLEYEKQVRLLLDQCFGTGDFYSHNLQTLGVQAKEVILNGEFVQKQWAKEHNIRYFNGLFQNVRKVRKLFPPKWDYKILEAQIKEYKPDVIYCQSLTYPQAHFLNKVKKYTKIIVGQVASPIHFKKEMLPFDLILTSFPHFVKRFQDIGIPSEYFKIGFEPRILNKLQNNEKKYDAVFVGGISRQHAEIISTFEYLAQNTKMDFWGYGSKHLAPESAFKKKHHGEAWGLKMYQILKDAKISINRHINVAENNANNMRLYETTGVGTMLITDHKDNIGELFEVGKEIETYKTKEELLEKINYYLSHNLEREKIAKAGQERTLKEHTYGMRMKELSGILEKYIK